MYAARHASIQLGDESLAKLKSELNTYYIDYEQVEIGESLGEGVCWSTVCNYSVWYAECLAQILCVGLAYVALHVSKSIPAMQLGIYT